MDEPRYGVRIEQPATPAFDPAVAEAEYQKAMDNFAREVLPRTFLIVAGVPVRFAVLVMVVMAATYYVHHEWWASLPALSLPWAILAALVVGPVLRTIPKAVYGPRVHPKFDRMEAVIAEVKRTQGRRKP